MVKTRLRDVPGVLGETLVEREANIQEVFQLTTGASEIPRSIALEISRP